MARHSKHKFSISPAANADGEVAPWTIATALRYSARPFSFLPALAMAMRLLIIEDDQETVRHVADTLAEDDYALESASDGASGMRLAASGRFDVLIIDRMLPVLDGLSIVRGLRAEGVGAPILLLTAMGAVNDRVAGLNGGADDYLIKPFAAAELRARVAALARRPSPRSGDQVVVSAGAITLDRAARQARVHGRLIDLLPIEAKLLELLVLNAGRVVTRKMLLEQVWGFHFDPKTNIVETHMSRLRAKIDLPERPSCITTIRGEGYVIRTPA